ncbi:MAG: xanthine dehydrogenase family protein molybdopterin-binding subunit [Pseudomonadales bacterium]|nr:xanthine dehydrogenase family protein molybdopterin-binding subunit [Pseudomonadales bacterium]MCP5186004.1 xanthine dehydrogenase family protein molybdopterin-binding subunit [Pseudomonadales bacterium]
MNASNLSRRRFLRNSGIVGGGLVIGLNLTGCSRAPLPVPPLADGLTPNAFLQITADNRFIFYCPRDEMGQGVTTGLATLIGEELDVHPADFEVRFGGVHPDYANPDFRMQMTGGSTSVKAHFLPLRQAGADTRALLLAAAAADLGVPVASLRTEAGHVLNGDDRHPYGRFVGTAASLDMPADTPLKSRDAFRYIGHNFPRVDGVLKATGTAQFGIDVDLPDMLHAVVRRSPVPGARLRSVDQAPALAMPGVTHVLAISTGVAVVAGSHWQAKQAAGKLAPVWEDVPLAGIDSATIQEDYARAMEGTDGVVALDEGDVELGFAAADKVVDARYWTPYLAHAPMEPMNAVIRIADGRAELWSGTQSVQAAQGLVARTADIDPALVTVHNTYLGGGFGRRGTLSHVTEVTEIALAVNKPVHLLWSREDDLRNGVYRPASLMHLRAGVDAGGNLVAWDAHRVGSNIGPDSLRAVAPGVLPGVGERFIHGMADLSDRITSDWFADPTSTEGLADDYDAAHRRVTQTTVNHGIPVTFWRSVGHSHTAFAKESMMDELALAAGQDPVAFRLKHTRTNKRLHNVIRIASEKLREMQPESGRFLGFAAHHAFDTDVAEIAEVSVTGNRIRVHKVTCVVDCGLAINPDVVRAQMEGGIVFGLTAALHGNLEIEGGAIRESNFHDYPLLRMDEAPDIEVIIVDSGEAPTGVGEPGVPPIAPAVANAVFRATGQRLRSLPLRLSA